MQQKQDCLSVQGITSSEPFQFTPLGSTSLPTPHIRHLLTLCAFINFTYLLTHRVNLFTRASKQTDGWTDTDENIISLVE